MRLRRLRQRAACVIGAGASSRRARVGRARLRQPARSPRHITCRQEYEDPPTMAGHNYEMCRTLRGAAFVTEEGVPCHTRPELSYLRAYACTCQSTPRKSTVPPITARGTNTVTPRSAAAT